MLKAIDIHLDSYLLSIKVFRMRKNTAQFLIRSGIEIRRQIPIIRLILRSKQEPNFYRAEIEKVQPSDEFFQSLKPYLRLSLISISFKSSYSFEFNIIQLLNMHRFKFPESLEDLQRIQNVHQLKLKLKQLKDHEHIRVSYKYYQRSNKYIYAYCAHCLSKIRYKYDSDQGNYNLTFSHIYHEHSNQKRSFYEAIMKFINQLPKSMSQSNVKMLVRQNFNITDSTYYYLYKKCTYPLLDYSQLVSDLEEKDCFIQSQPWEKGMKAIPEILLVVSPEMKRMYQSFGHIVYFDTTFNLVRQKHQNGNSWKLGLFIGLNSAKKIIPFGFCLVLQETKEAFYKIFKSFFQIMDKTPLTIITDESISIKSALNQLKMGRQFDGVHLLDNFHIIRNIRKRLKNKGNLRYFVELMRIRFEEQFHIKSEEYFSLIDNEEDLQTYTNFIKNSPDYCFSQSPTTFIGISITDSACQKANDIIKSRLKIEKPFTIVVKQCLQVLENLIIKSQENFKIQKKIVEDYYCFGEIKWLRLILCQSIFKELIKQIREIYRLEAKEQTQISWSIRDYDHIVYHLRLEQQVGQWRCSCRYLEKCGLPCCHLCKLLKMKGIQIQRYIHERWKRQYLDQSINRKLGRGRDTRRNK